MRKFPYTTQTIVSIFFKYLNRLEWWCKSFYGKLTNKTEEEIGRNLIPSQKDMEVFSRNVVLLNLIMKMGELFYANHTDNKALVGIACIFRNEFGTEEAIRWESLYNDAKTIQDVWDYFLTENKINVERVKFNHSYDDDFFKWLLSKEVTLDFGFGVDFNRAYENANNKQKLETEAVNFRSGSV
jgi:hypothetical protein